MADIQNLIQFILSTAAAGALFAGFVIILRQYLLKHYLSSLYLAIAWLGFFLEAFFGSISKLFFDGFLAPIFLKLSYIALIPAFLGVLALVDSLMKEKIGIIRFSIVFLVLGLNGFVLLIPPFYTIFPFSYYVVVTVGLMMSVASYLIYIRIYKQAPLDLKRSAIINLIGAFSVSFVYVILNILESTVPGTFPPISRVFEAGGALTQAIVFSRNEQLFYILPFKTQRLLVLDSASGFSIFSHNWSKTDSIISNDLLSRIFQGMTLIINESVSKGKVLEFKMEQGVILICHNASHRVIGLLVSSKSVKVLSQGLLLFVRKFSERCDQYRARGDTLKLVDDATSLVHECFPFVPQYERDRAQEIERVVINAKEM